MRKITNIIKWMVVAFFVTTIFSVIIYKYVPVYVTPLMVIRTVGSSESIHHKWISLEDMPKDIVKAVIASEDAHFLSHNGFDFKAIKQAIEHNKKIIRLSVVQVLSVSKQQKMYSCGHHAHGFVRVWKLTLRFL